MGVRLKVREEYCIIIISKSISKTQRIQVQRLRFLILIYVARNIIFIIFIVRLYSLKSNAFTHSRFTMLSFKAIFLILNIFTASAPTHTSIPLGLSRVDERLHTVGVGGIIFL